MKFDKSFWESVAAEWARRLSAEQQKRISEKAEKAVEISKKEKERYGTDNNIPSALEAIMSDEDDDDDEFI